MQNKIDRTRVEITQISFDDRHRRSTETVAIFFDGKGDEGIIQTIKTLSHLNSVFHMFPNHRT